MSKKKFRPEPSRRKTMMVLRLRREFKERGLPIERAVDHAIRAGFLRQDAVAIAHEAYGTKRSTGWVRMVQGGGVSPR